MDDFIRVTDVPIFDSHGDFTPSELREIARNSQARIDDSGSECPLTLGHTPKRGENKPWPKIVGWAGNFKVQKFGKTNPRDCIYADFKIYKRHAAMVRDQYRRRSIELWRVDKIIDPIALLSSSTPARDLGLLTFQRHRAGEPLRFEFANDEFDNLMSAFEQSPMGVWARRQMQIEQEQKTNRRIGDRIINDVKRRRANQQLEVAMQSNDVEATRAALQERLESVHKYARDFGVSFDEAKTAITQKPERFGKVRELRSQADIDAVHLLARNRKITYAAAVEVFKSGV
jgi:hypothetical protein